jgi:hypothetical protein
MIPLVRCSGKDGRGRSKTAPPFYVCQGLKKAMAMATATAPTEQLISPRAKAIAQGLIRTDRAETHGVYDRGMLRLECLSGGFYWIALNGSRLLRGARLPTAEELQPKFIEAMARAGW